MGFRYVCIDPTCLENEKCTDPVFVSMTAGTITKDSVMLPFIPTVRLYFNSQVPKCAKIKKIIALHTRI